MTERFGKTAEEIAEKVGPILKARIEAEVRANRDPSGGAYVPAQGGQKMFQNFELKMQIRGASIVYTFSRPYFFHGAGIANGAPTRGMLPEPGDKIISEAIDEAVEEWKKEKGL